MKILHTGDWHLGKHLEGVSRLEEQAQFLTDFVSLVKEKEIDLILIAGDVYDTFNPASKAESLFYKTLKNISEDGQRLIVVIPGNHDNPNRLVSARPLAREHGIIMVDSLKTVMPCGDYGKHQVINSGEGFVEVMIKGEKAVIVTVPYPSEKRLEEVYLKEEDSELEHLDAYQTRLNRLFEETSAAFKTDSINIVMSHLFAMGAEETGSERSIQLGGSYIVNSSCFPKNADYVALGHIHKPMILPKTDKKVRYSGSPLHYNKKERPFQKGCYILEGDHKTLDIHFEPFKVYKPIEVWRVQSIEEAILKCENHKDDSSYVYLEIESDRYIQEHEIKEMKRFKKDILEITPIIQHIDEAEAYVNFTEEPLEKLFEAFYLKERSVKPSEETMALLMNILGREDETD